MEAGRWIVPLSYLHGTCLVPYIDYIKPVSATVRIIVVRYRVQFAVRQLVVYKDPVVVLRDLDVNHPGDFGIIGG